MNASRVVLDSIVLQTPNPTNNSRITTADSGFRKSVFRVAAVLKHILPNVKHTLQYNNGYTKRAPNLM